MELASTNPIILMRRVSNSYNAIFVKFLEELSALLTIIKFIFFMAIIFMVMVLFIISCID